jgi:hypothetical protein
LSFKKYQRLISTKVISYLALSLVQLNIPIFLAVIVIVDMPGHLLQSARMRPLWLRWQQVCPAWTLVGGGPSDLGEQRREQGCAESGWQIGEKRRELCELAMGGILLGH